MSRVLGRREFLQAALLAGTAVPAVTSSLLSAEPRAEPQAGAQIRSPNEKLNLAFIGVWAKGLNNLRELAHENVVMLCDIDSERLNMAHAMFPKAQKVDDYRKVFDVPNLDGVVISTPDHMHAIPTAIALRQGLAVYCEKPLTHSIHELRIIKDLAAKHNCITQMGTQIHAGANYRRVVEIIQAGVIGQVSRVHVWQSKQVPACYRAKADAMPPSHVNYDLWLGPAPYRPFHKSHFHFDWRWWWDFGGGNLADMACHYMDLPYWALGLKYPTSVIAKGEKGHDGDNECPAKMRVDYHYPAPSASQPGVHLTWYHGGWMPEGAEVYKLGSAVLFEGTDGRLLADYGTNKLFMQQGKEARPVAPSIPDSIGHWKEWTQAIRTRKQPTCHFEYAGTLTEAPLLGNVSYRAGGVQIDWDAAKATVTNHPAANQFLRREYRKGWTL